ncbi:SDR family oxidoreductase [Shewanella japonica]|uniref:SDR family oxidoreductase n=1 Tax=Shewanella japonica TaxID=93973 RepID=UPI000E707B57|nr:SDR family oxidoreductase [Shewanella japonica]
MNDIAIVGCGWFGLPLAKLLVEQGFNVSGTKRTAEGCASLLSHKINPFELDLSTINDNELESKAMTYAGLFDADMLIVNIPPGLRRGESQYLTHVQRLISLIGERQYQRVIFISTTGVYPAIDKDMTENDAQVYDDKSAILLKAESQFAAMNNSCILRFSGLIGPKRHPGKFFAGRENIAGGNVAVNLVHLDDCIQAVTSIVKATSAHQAVNETYNLAAPKHPTRSEFYRYAAKHLGLAEPSFNDDKQPSKVIVGDLICQQLAFNYIHSDPMLMLDAC